MARGWESKSVADQMEEQQKSREEARLREKLTADEKDRTQKLESLVLSKSRILGQLERASVPAHRQMLSRALADVENQIEQLSEKG
jgi:hypothetical protein